MTSRTDQGGDGGPAPGGTFGRYVIVRELGRGAMGSVYEATRGGSGERVAVKVLHPDAARRPGVRARFLREGEAASRVRHPHVVSVSDVGEEGGVAYLAMEYLEGETLGALLEREGALPLDRVAELLLPVCSAVAAAHAGGVVHRDLKPDNVILARAPGGAVRPTLVDFGVSKLPGGSDAPLTASEAFLGTAAYMSPEQAVSSKHVDARSDQYALGVMLYECATGARPFAAAEKGGMYALLADVVRGDFPPPRDVLPSLPEGFERVVLRAMRRDPSARFPSVLHLGHALLAFAAPGVREAWDAAFRAATAATAAERPTAAADTLDERPARPPRRRLRPALVAACVVPIGVAIALASRAPPAPRRAPAAPPVTASPPAVAPASPPPPAAPVASANDAGALPPRPARRARALARTAPPPVVAPDVAAPAVPAGASRLPRPE